MPAQIIAPLAQVCAALVWTHWLAPGPYGLLTFLIASQDLLFLVCMSWWTQYTLRYLSGLSGPARTDFLRAETSIFLLTFGLQIVGVFVVVSLLRQPITIPQIFAAIVFTGTRSLLNYLGERARAQSRIAIYTLGQFASSIAGFAVAYAAVVLVAPTPEAVLFGFALAQAFGIVVLWQRLGVVWGDLLPPVSVLRKALDYGAPLLAAGALSWLAQNGIRIIVEWVDGADALGLIAVGWGLGMRLSTTLAMLVVTASFPLAVQSLKHGSRADAFGYLSNGGAMLCGLIVPAAIGICFLISPFANLFVAEPFRAMTIAILPFAAATGAARNIRVHVADPVFLLIERPRMTTILNLVDTALVIIGCVLGAWIDGPMGAVAGCTIATVIGALIGFAMAYGIAGFHFPYLHGLRIGVASAIMALALTLIPWSSLVEGHIMSLVIEASVGAFVYGLAIAVLYPTQVRSLLTQIRSGSENSGTRAASSVVKPSSSSPPAR